MNPAVLDAFALAIFAAGGPPAYPGVAGHEPDVAKAAKDAQAIAAGIAELRRLVPNAGSYVSESDYFEPELAALVLGRELRAPARREEPLRPRSAVPRPSRRRQRARGRRAGLIVMKNAIAPATQQQIGAAERRRRRR